MLNNAWRCLTLALIAAIIAVACLTYRPEHKAEPVALWSRKWVGPSYQLHRAQLVRFGVWRIPR